MRVFLYVIATILTTVALILFVATLGRLLPSFISFLLFMAVTVIIEIAKRKKS